MARQILTTWGEYQAAIDRLLALAERDIRIFDPDLQALSLDSATRLPALQRLLAAESNPRLHIAVRDADPLTRRQPRLLGLLASHHHLMAVQQVPEHLASLRDALFLVDGRHGLIRFDREQPRSKLLLDDNDELRPYLQRFEEIWEEGGTPLSAIVLGL